MLSVLSPASALQADFFEWGLLGRRFDCRRFFRYFQLLVLAGEVLNAVAPAIQGDARQLAWLD